MKDIGEQVRELLPEYPHLWSRVIAWAEKERECEVYREALKFYADKRNWGTYVGDVDSGKNSMLITEDSEHYSDVWVGHRAREALEAGEKVKSNG